MRRQQFVASSDLIDGLLLNGSQRTRNVIIQAPVAFTGELWATSGVYSNMYNPIYITVKTNLFSCSFPDASKHGESSCRTAVVHFQTPISGCVCNIYTAIHKMY